MFAWTGADIVHGGGGDDIFHQIIEPSVDQLFGDAGLDTIDYSLAGSAVIVQLSGYSTSGAGALLATFSSVEAAIGSSENDALIGTADNNRLEGGFGADWLGGGGGDDAFVQVLQQGVDHLFGGTPDGDSGFDTIDYSGAGWGVIVQLSGYAVFDQGFGATLLATFSGIEAATGSAFADALIGTDANNRIDGGAGADWLVGQGGDDTFVQVLDTASVDRLFGGLPGADAGADTIDYSGATAGVIVQLSGYATTNDSARALLATFDGIENVAGTDFADALIGNGFDNRMTGGGGGDWLVGGLGADTFVYQSAGDGSGDSIRDFSQVELDKIDLSGIDADPTTGADDPFVFATIRHAGVVGEAVVTNFGPSSLVSLYLDGDDAADMTLRIVHGQAVMNAGDFVL